MRKPSKGTVLTVGGAIASVIATVLSLFGSRKVAEETAAATGEKMGEAFNRKTGLRLPEQTETGN